ncbi:YhcN/YlaJ family sporulation lipoprotein [Natronobacillus azotifigens]|uniref:YhcN/YlaJ family sporulation lipoprotein n=1 Tax=Natronobacillus azotifigens TaxID=472978 RepID=A0A9J6R9U2_9BACI|nr:YhcN/YlaJ family sporulation lipoprotein [Natronobacillus azotifigens]MCZ0702075.1 YhcN/YlaJ family sporulation lipoprotein [Natronobacillus azotifigens]
MDWKKCSVILLTAGSLTACGMQNDNVGQGNLNDNVQPMRNRTTQEQGTPNGYGDAGWNQGYGNQMTYDGTYPRGTQTTDPDMGRYNHNDRDGNTGLSPGGMNQTRDGGMNQTRGGNQANTNYDLEDEIASKISSEVDNIDRAYVLTTGSNAYVAVELNAGRDAGGNSDQVSDEIEREVTRVVKDESDRIDNVYVSSNPDFVNLSTNYANDVDRGQPVEGFFEQIGEMIQRVFPGTNNTNNRTNRNTNTYDGTNNRTTPNN